LKYEENYLLFSWFVFRISGQKESSSNLHIFFIPFSRLVDNIIIESEIKRKINIKEIYHENK